MEILPGHVQMELFSINTDLPIVDKKVFKFKKRLHSEPFFIAVINYFSI